MLMHPEVRVNNRKLIKTIKDIHEKSHRIYGAPQITNNLPADKKQAEAELPEL